MKKVFVLVFVLVATATSVFSVNPVNYKVVYNLNSEPTFNALVRYLDADTDQADKLKYVFGLTENKMRTALKTGNETFAENVLLFNVGNAKYILTDSQYKKYLMVLNLSINNENNEFLTQK